MVRMTVEGVGFDHLRQTVVVLKDWDSRKLLPIWIGAAEAKSIALHLEGAAPPRPLSHDLVLRCIGAAGGTVERVVINDLQENTFFATIDIQTARGTIHLDARPSDAIALAVRAKCPVFVAGGALEALVDIGEDEEETPLDTPPDNPADDEMDRFRRLVGDLDI
ncbi:MAG TPA: bifunctional nuclease family protein [Abditibacteriaceae bacterium]